MASAFIFWRWLHHLLVNGLQPSVQRENDVWIKNQASILNSTIGLCVCVCVCVSQIVMYE